MKLKKLIYCAGIWAAVMAPLPAQADWSADFIAPQSAAGALRIDLPTGLDMTTLTMLGVELDGTDITAMLSLDGEDFVYTPVEPLDAGEHIVRLVVLGDALQEKGRWVFTVADGAADAAEDFGVPDEREIAQAEDWLRGGSVDIDTLTEFSNRIIEDDLADAPNHSIVSGAGDLNASAQSGNWEIRGRANYLAQSDHDLALTGNTVDLGEYDLSADYAGERVKGGVTLGHHDIGLDSNLISGFYRRGASARLGSADERVMAQGFAFRPESVSGARDFTGLNDNDDRLEGFAATVKPFSNGIDALEVTGVYFDGRGDDGGTGTAVSDVTSEGSGWGAIIEKSFGQERLKLRGEYAHALYDPDAGSGTADEEAGDAVSLSLETRPFESMIFLDKQADIVVGARYDRIDTFFQSPANEGLAADRDAVTAYSNIYWGALSGSLQLIHETNNVDDVESMAKDRMRSASMSLAYSFDPQEGRLAWLGSPYLNFTGFVADLDRMETPDNYSGFDTNNVSDSWTFGGGSNYESWYWNASYTLSQYEDHANVSSDTVNNFTSFGAGWMVNKRLNLNSGLSFGSFRDEDNADTTYDTNINMGVNAIVIPDLVHFNMDYNLNLSSGSGDSPDRHIVNSEVEYTLIQPGRNRPGVALALRGSMEDENGNADSTDDETAYQVFTVLRVKAPFGFRF